MKKFVVFQVSKFALIAWCVLCSHGCKTLKVPVMVPTDDSTSITETSIRDLLFRDTIPIPADTSAWLQMLIECDSEGNARVTDIYNQMGQRSRIMMKEYFQQDSIIQHQDSLLKTRKKLVIRTTCQCDSMSIYAEFRLRDTTYSKVLRITKKIPVPVPMELTWWEKFKIEYGGYAFGVIAAIILFYLIRLAIWIFATFTPQGAAVSAGTGILSTIFRLFLRK